MRLQRLSLPTYVTVGRTRYNVHSSDGYARVAVFIQLPEMLRFKIDQRVLELILMSHSPRIMTNDSGDRIRAIQGHSLERFDTDELYEKVNTLEEYVHHPKWGDRDAPDQLVLEFTNENHLDQWRRLGTFVPSVVRRFHTMRAVCGTVKQEFGAKNIVLYAFLSVQALLEHSPKLDVYITHHGRIVTKCGLPPPFVDST